MSEAEYRRIRAQIAETDEVVNALAAMTVGDPTARRLFVSVLEANARNPGERMNLSGFQAEERAEIISIAQELLAERAKRFRKSFGMPDD